ncbi:hypothetical protein BT96DRAFT_925800 [Gymnopus androsaceus JB14]|uniref:Cyclic nucleotide-binding domain-containing protein n=1 Tax=Gymnopus androsaceus JB14 TaxID=1447944 RepID=A0A6A4GXX4_9AGAR|nr:hypothetical protein BT96DRAFT_925800 [Gymnopus androsaceus JB14]
MVRRGRYTVATSRQSLTKDISGNESFGELGAVKEDERPDETNILQRHRFLVLLRFAPLALPSPIALSEFPKPGSSSSPPSTLSRAIPDSGV